MSFLEVEDEAVEVVLELLDLEHPARIEVSILHDFPGLLQELIPKLLLGVSEVVRSGPREQLAEVFVELLVLLFIF